MNRRVIRTAWLSVVLTAVATLPARSQTCAGTSAALASRLPDIADPELQRLRAAVLGTDAAAIIAASRAQGLTPAQAISLARQQSAAYDETLRSSRDCAMQVFDGDAAALGRALDARRYTVPLPSRSGGSVSIDRLLAGGGSQNMLGSCLRAYIAADIGRIGTDAAIGMLSCGGATGVATPGATGTTASTAGSPRPLPSASGPRGAGGGDALATALGDLNRQLREQQMATATPEMAAFLAQQDALQAQHEANLAASSAGFASGTRAAREGALADQVAMVQKAVKGWKPPRAYSTRSARTAVSLADPFAPFGAAEGTGAPPDLPAGLEWDPARGLARVRDAAGPCHGRLRVGDYPLLPDGSLLDTGARVTEFMRLCVQPDAVLNVVVESGQVERRP